jgi:hypothetical protein
MKTINLHSFKQIIITLIPIDLRIAAIEIEAIGSQAKLATKPKIKFHSSRLSFPCMFLVLNIPVYTLSSHHEEFYLLGYTAV